jgi:hypothetical protein
MDQMRRLYPGLSIDHVRALADIVAVERNGVLSVNEVYRSARWGVACLSYDVPRLAIRQLTEEGGHPWLRYIKENGTGYAVAIDGVPLRIQRDEPEIRNVLPGERAVMREQLLLMPGTADPGTVLRLEISQPTGQPVDTITLYLFEEDTGVTLDSEVVYTRHDAATATADDGSPGGSAPTGAIVLPFVRRAPAQDADPKTRFTFDDPDAVKDGDGDDDE